MLCAALETSSELSAEEPFLDLVFHLDDGSVVHLHSLVLAASSQYFSSLGKVRTAERNEIVCKYWKHKYTEIGEGGDWGGKSLSLHWIALSEFIITGGLTVFFLFLRNFFC